MASLRSCDADDMAAGWRRRRHPRAASTPSHAWPRARVAEAKPSLPFLGVAQSNPVSSMEVCLFQGRGFGTNLAGAPSTVCSTCASGATKRCVTTSGIASISHKHSPRMLEHMFFDGEQWHGCPWRHGKEVGCHSLMFESLCQAVLADLLKYERRHPDIPKLPTPMVLVIIRLSRYVVHGFPGTGKSAVIG